MILSEYLCAFVQSGVSISLSAASEARVPYVTKVQGCRISNDRRRITLFASRTASADVIRCVEANRIVTAVFSMPPSHETYQIKGHEPRLESLLPGDMQLLLSYRKAFAKEIESFGFPAHFSDTLFDFPEEDLVAISFEPAAVFDQTPGPKAGAAVEAQ